jgi:AcrR family transcriptional regulator
MPRASESPASPPEAPRRRGRPPSDELIARRREELIAAAYEVFSEKGYTAAGIADIAQKLDIGHGTFYRYFESKRDILDHVVDYGFEHFVDTIQQDDAPEAPQTLDEFLDQMRHISERFFALIEREPGLVQVLMLEATSIDEELTARLMGLMDTMGALITTRVEHGIRKGFLRPDLDAEVIAHGLGVLVIPGMIQALRGTFDAKQQQRYTDELIRFVAEGLRTR